MIKRCNVCHQEKNITDFRKDKSKVDGYRYECKECSRTYGRSRYMEQYSQTSAKWNAKRYTDIKERVIEYKLQHPCICCSETEPVVLEFHHKDPTQKDFQIGGNHNRNWDNVLREIEKCVVLCANCHRKVHAGLITIL